MWIAGKSPQTNDLCWDGPIRGGHAPVPFDWFQLLQLDGSRVRYGRAQTSPDGTTSVSWRGIRSRGWLVVDTSGRVTEASAVERYERGAISTRLRLAYPDTMHHIDPRPVWPDC